MRSPGIAKIQHYVPRFLLRHFGIGKKDQVNVFDKQTGRVFVTNAKNVAAESGFYNFRVNNTELTIESSLSRLESRAKDVLERLLNADSTAVMTTSDRKALSAFFAVQFTRTLTFRQNWKAFPEAISARMKSQMKSKEELRAIDEAVPIPNENDLKAQTARIIIDAPRDVVV